MSQGAARGDSAIRKHVGVLNVCPGWCCGMPSSARVGVCCGRCSFARKSFDEELESFASPLRVGDPGPSPLQIGGAGSAALSPDPASTTALSVSTSASPQAAGVRFGGGVPISPITGVDSPSGNGTVDLFTPVMSPAGSAGSGAGTAPFEGDATPTTVAIVSTAKKGYAYDALTIRLGDVVFVMQCRAVSCCAVLCRAMDVSRCRASSLVTR